MSSAAAVIGALRVNTTKKFKFRQMVNNHNYMYGSARKTMVLMGIC